MGDMSAANAFSAGDQSPFMESPKCQSLIPKEQQHVSPDWYSEVSHLHVSKEYDPESTLCLFFKVKKERSHLRLLGMLILFTENSGTIFNANTLSTHHLLKFTPQATQVLGTVRTAQHFSEKPSNELIIFCLNYLQEQLNKPEKKN